MSVEIQDRLEALETRIAHFERANEDLSDVVARQSAEIDRLKKQMSALSSRVLDLQQDWRSDGMHEKPPHY